MVNQKVSTKEAMRVTSAIVGRAEGGRGAVAAGDETKSCYHVQGSIRRSAEVSGACLGVDLPVLACRKTWLAFLSQVDPASV